MRLDRSDANIQRLKSMTRTMRLEGLDMAVCAGGNGAHLGGGMSCMEILAVLYGEVLRLDPQKPEWPERDRFLASKAHCLLALYPALCIKGYIPHTLLQDFTADGSPLTGYLRDLSLGLEYSGGSLGMAISVGVGLALAAKEKKQEHRIYVLMGDGELNEGSVWEAFMSAAQYKLGNLVAIIDRNHLAYDGDTEQEMALDDLAAKMRAFNWHTIECNGHDIADLLRAFEEVADDRPTIIIAQTVKGKGVSFMENRPEWHQKQLTQAQYEQARREVMEAN